MNNFLKGKNKRKYQRYRLEFVRTFKNLPCKDCGIKYPPCAMDFDHRDPSHKIQKISSLTCSSFKRLKEEIYKCDVVCANCHRIRTAKQRLEGLFANKFGDVRRMDVLTNQLSLKFDEKENIMSDEMINKTKPYNKSSGLQGIGDTIKAMNEHDMNNLNDPIATAASQSGKGGTSKYNKNS